LSTFRHFLPQKRRKRLGSVLATARGWLLAHGNGCLVRPSSAETAGADARDVTAQVVFDVSLTSADLAAARDGGRRKKLDDIKRRENR
jgi:hypothetical protein